MTTIKQRYVKAVKVDKLIPHPDNPRRSDDATIADSIAAHGFYGAVIAQESSGTIIAGHGRLRNATAAGQTSVPVVYIDVDDDEARRIMLVDNRSNDQATYDDTALAQILSDMDGDLEGSGYTSEDLDAIIDAMDTSGFAPVDDVASLDEIEPKVCPHCGETL